MKVLESIVTDFKIESFILDSDTDEKYIVIKNGPEGKKEFQCPNIKELLRLHTVLVKEEFKEVYK